jgi:hypothetical protein
LSHSANLNLLFQMQTYSWLNIWAPHRLTPMWRAWSDSSWKRHTQPCSLLAQKDRNNNAETEMIASSILQISEQHNLL